MTALTDIEVDFCREFTSICVGHAANRMALMYPEPVWISSPAVFFESYSDSACRTFFDTDQQPLITISVGGDIHASMLIGFSPRTREVLCSRFFGSSPCDWDKTMVQSMMLEICNIMISAWTTAAEQISGFLMLPQIPRIAGDGIPELVAKSRHEDEDGLIMIMNTELQTIRPTRQLLRFLTFIKTGDIQRIMRASGGELT